jgi:hypothetical protein
MTAKKDTTASTETGLTTSGPDGTGVVTSRNNNESDPTGVNPAATWETSTNPPLATDPDQTAEVRHPIQCLAPMPCRCPACIGTGTDTNTLNAEEAADAADAAAPNEQTEEEAAAGAKAAEKTAADNKAAADKADDKTAK